MLDVYSRHRPLALLATVVLAQVLLLAYQIRRDREGREVRLLRYWAVELVTPVERAGTWTFSHIGGAWSGYVGLRNARSQNQKLQAELDQLRMRNRELETTAGEAERLEHLLGLRDTHPEITMLAAQVIGASADPTSHTLFINRGERDHIRKNLPVVTPEGIVGKIVEVQPDTSQILLINDKESGVGALFQPTRTKGIVKGTGDTDPRMDYVSNDEKVQPGEMILTSGEDRIFPKGLLVGYVSSAAPGNPFQNIHIQPAVRLDRLEDVIVLLSSSELKPQKSDQVTGAAEIASEAAAAKAAAAAAAQAAAQPKPPAAGAASASSLAAKPAAKHSAPAQPAAAPTALTHPTAAASPQR
jgi:rod shape-determining protein MreC